MRCVAVVPRAWAREASGAAADLFGSITLREEGARDDSWLWFEGEGEGEAECGLARAFSLEGVLPMVASN